MSDKPETSADIITEVRNEFSVHNCDQCTHRKSCEMNNQGFDTPECKGKRESIALAFGISDGYIMEILARLDAARRREVSDAMQTAFRTKCEVCNRMNGNAAAMREALANLVDVIDRCDSGSPLWWHCGAKGVKPLKDAKAALAKPPRNCDRFGGDYKMLHTAWFDWTGSPSGQNPDGTVKLTFSEWLLEKAVRHEYD